MHKYTSKYYKALIMIMSYGASNETAYNQFKKIGKRRYTMYVKAANKQLTGFVVQGTVTGRLNATYNPEPHQLPVKDFTVWMNEGFIGEQHAGIGFQQTKALLLADGTELSIQAGPHNYCEPRQLSVNGDYNEYDSFEIGFPSKEIPEIMEYCANPDEPTETVYSYVPKQVIRDLIAARGGVVGYKELKD